MAQRDCLKKLKPATVVRRKNVNRKIVDGRYGETAGTVIGDLEPGCEIYGFTKGQFSCIHILEHILKQTGPADVVICTWSAASGDISAAHNMLTVGGIKSLRFIVDFSFKSRKPKFCQELIENFGADAIRVTSIHAKFMTVKNDKWNICIRTSMNLNYNPRFENFEISDDKQMLDFMHDVVDDIYETQEAHEGFISPTKGKESFKKLYPPSQQDLFAELVPASSADMIVAKLDDFNK